MLRWLKQQGEPVNAEPHKCDELRWTEVDDLPENTIPYVRRAIENFRSGVVFEEYDLPGLKTVNGVAEYPGSRSAWFKDPEGNIITVSEMG